MKMKILIIGSSQVKHIKAIYNSIDVEVEELELSDGDIVAKMCNLIKCLRSNIIYYVGGSDYKKNKFLRLGKLLNKKIIVHWIGTDVLHEMARFKETGSVINKDIINLAVT